MLVTLTSAVSSRLGLRVRFMADGEAGVEFVKYKLRNASMYLNFREIRVGFSTRSDDRRWCAGANRTRASLQAKRPSTASCLHTGLGSSHSS
jgi:hypothetical protein